MGCSLSSCIIVEMEKNTQQDEKDCEKNDAGNRRIQTGRIGFQRRRLYCLLRLPAQNAADWWLKQQTFVSLQLWRVSAASRY